MSPSPCPARSFNLIDEPWIPVERADGTRDWIRPADLAGGPATAPPVALAWPRADFRLAGLEFLIGLLSTAFPPADDAEWADRFFTPPQVAELQGAFQRVRDAFWLDGEGPRFCQDLDAQADNKRVSPPERLLIEAPGNNARKGNTDLVVKRDRVSRMSRAGAGIALFTLQAWAPQGGKRYWTSMRGGGPLTTLVLPGAPAGAGALTLWHVVWANVRCGSPPAPADLPRVFPWLTPIPVRPVTPKDAHHLQAFWGMPRRIRLIFEAVEPDARCDLLGISDPVMVSGCKQLNNGIEYFGWLHWLTPYGQERARGPGRSEERFVPVGARRVGYRDWHSLVHADTDAGRRPAGCVTAFLERRREMLCERDRRVVERARLLVGGYHVDKAKALEFLEAEFPVLATVDSRTFTRQVRLARRLAKGASKAEEQLREAVKRGSERLAGRQQGRGRGRRKGNKAPQTLVSLLQAVQGRFWRETEAEFFRLLEQAHAALETGGLSEEAGHKVADDWRAYVGRTCLRLFDQALPVDPDMDLMISGGRIAARRALGLSLHGYGSAGKKLFAALQLPVPETRKTRRKEAAG